MSVTPCPIPCNLCGSSDVDVIATKDRDGHPLRTTICRGCGLVWSNPRPSEQAVRQYYSRDYRLDYKRKATPSLRHIARSGRGAAHRVSDIKAFLKPGDRVLDAGAGGGEVVYALRHRGFEAVGLEPDERYARHARETLGVPVQTGFVQDASFAPGSFRVITMYHALEHVEDPVGILSTLRGWLSGDGLLLIEVPNVEATCMHPRHRFHFAHFYNFNSATLQGVARRAGFEAVRTSTSADAGNLIAIFRPHQKNPAIEPGALSGIPGNYARVSRIIRSHTAAGYYLSATPYVGPIRRLRAFFKDKAATRGRATAREVLDGIIEQT
jgi:SAM-dependent methyltransferase